MDLKYDGGYYQGKVLMFFLVLINLVGGFEQLVLDVLLDDGKFIMIIVKMSNFVKMFYLMILVFNGGKYINDLSIIYVKMSKVVVKLVDKDCLMINLDGEYGGDVLMMFWNLK